MEREQQLAEETVVRAVLAARPAVVRHVQLRGRRTRLRLRRTAGDGSEHDSERFQLQNAIDIPAVARRRSHGHADEPGVGLPSARELQVAIVGPGSSAVRGTVRAARNVGVRLAQDKRAPGSGVHGPYPTTPNNPGLSLSHDVRCLAR